MSLAALRIHGQLHVLSSSKVKDFGPERVRLTLLRPSASLEVEVVPLEVAARVHLGWK
jgi:hypothetical protein